VSRTVTLELDDQACRPGDELAGTLRWTWSEAPSSARLRLGWRSTSRGHVDQEVVVDLDVRELPEVGAGAPYRGAPAGATGRPLAARDLRRFVIRLPHQPYSFHGHTFTITWHLEARFAPGDVLAEQLVVLSPTGAPFEHAVAGETAADRAPATDGESG